MKEKWQFSKNNIYDVTWPEVRWRTAELAHAVRNVLIILVFEWSL